MNKIILGIPAYQFSWILMSLGALVASFLIRTYMQWPVSKTTQITSLGVILGVIALIFYDLIFEKGSHNLFPLEIIISSIIVLPSAFLGASFSKPIQNFKK